MKKSKIHLDVLDKSTMDIIKKQTAEEVITALRDQVWDQRDKLTKEDGAILRYYLNEIFSISGILLESISGYEMVKEMSTEDERLLMMFVLGSFTQQANIFTPLMDGLEKVKDQDIRKSEGGNTTAAKRKAEAEELKRKIVKAWDKLSNIDERYRSNRIAEHLRVKPETIRRHVNTLNLRKEK